MDRFAPALEKLYKWLHPTGFRHLDRMMTISGDLGGKTETEMLAIAYVMGGVGQTWVRGEVRYRCLHLRYSNCVQSQVSERSRNCLLSRLVPQW